jgi:Reverse transcriptase (RNA-dependent DNA polymerase)
MRSGLLAVRAINQYRRRDVLSYLGLRYYLENDCSKNDLWANDISRHLVNTRDKPIYHRSYHFKEIAKDGNPEYRNIYLPGANEILAESALIYECSKEPAFKSLNCVYSYHFPDISSKEGIFKNYFTGFQRRNNSIANVCTELNDSSTIVRYTDIKKFYPSIRHELALEVWKSACDTSAICNTSRELGERLLSQYAEKSKANNDGLGVLTGPMFSHFIANLVLNKVDEKMSQHMDDKYWRYVDDFVLVGSPNQINTSRNLLHSMLSDMGFSLHDEGKDFEVESNVYLEVAGNSDNSKSNLWRNLIGNIKRFLITKPEELTNLKNAFSAKGINIPLLDYSNTVSEFSYQERFYDWLSKYSWAPEAVSLITINNLVTDALRVRDIYHREVNIILNNDSNVEGYKRKQLISKIRFYAMRLSYLAIPEILVSLSSDISSYPELYLQSSVMSAIYSQDVSSLIKLGANAAQAAAQVLRIQDSTVKCSANLFEEVELQSLAVLRLNGIEVEFSGNLDCDVLNNDPLNQFASGKDQLDLMKSNDLFVKEIACLRGIERPLRHKCFLDTAFDRDEQLSFDIIDQLQVSSYF